MKTKNETTRSVLKLGELEKRIRELKKAYREKGKTDDWIASWERSFRKTYVS